MKKIFAIIVAVCFTWFSAIAQPDTSFKLIRIVKGDIAAFSVDNLDNIYILDNRNQLKKYNSNGDSVAVFNDVKKYGQVTYMDVSNPLKVLLYYQNFSTVVMLDRVLNIRNIVDLRKQNIFRAKAIGQSYDNKIWVYDELEYKLKKLDEDGKLLQETPDFRLLLGQALTPQKIFDENKYVYLYDSTYGVYVFDYYGALKNNIMIQRWNNFKVAGKFIFGSKSDTLFRYEISAFQYDDWKMPEQIYRSRSFDFSASRLYALKKDGIEIYSIR
jgi:hypothetical protein